MTEAKVQLGIFAGDWMNTATLSTVFKKTGRNYKNNTGIGSATFTELAGPRTNIVTTMGPESDDCCGVAVQMEADILMRACPGIKKMIFVGTVVPAADSGVRDGDVVVVDGKDGLVWHRQNKDGQLELKRGDYKVGESTQKTIAKMKEVKDIGQQLATGARVVAKGMRDSEQYESTAGGGEEASPLVHYGTVSCGDISASPMVVSDDSKKEFKVLGHMYSMTGFLMSCEKAECVFILGACSKEYSAYGKATSAVYAKLFVDNIEVE